MKFHKPLKQLIFWYLFAILLVIAIIGLMIFFSDLNNKWRVLLQTLGQLFTKLPTYFVLLLPYLFSILFKSFIIDYKKRGYLGVLKGFIYKIVLPVGIIWLSIKVINNYRLSENFQYTWDYSIENTSKRIRNLYDSDRKQRGFHVFGMKKDSISYELLKKNNVEWLTYVPFIYQTQFDTPSLRTNFVFDTSNANYSDWQNLKSRADAYGFKIMLKPHMWLINRDNGIWRADIAMNSETDWNTWFEIYSDYMLNYAQLAESLQMEMFCIGTELKSTIALKPEKWQQLIKDIRKVYSGKLTYGANWDSEVHEIPFWKELDFIGVQAYYPIAKNLNPELSELETGWNSHVDTLETLSKTHNKPIIFTELGYKSTEDSGIRPWEWSSMTNRFHKKISKRTQALCYEAFFNTIWEKDWFEGVHIWEWQSHSNNSDGNNTNFVVQGKPALNIIAKGFKRTTD